MNPRAPAGGNQLRPGVLLEVTLAQSDVAVPYRDSEVAAANRVTVEEIAAGGHDHLPPSVVQWFDEHASEAVSPTHIGYTWYPDLTTARMQLVDTRLLALDPNPRVGSVLWASRAVINHWQLSPIDLDVTDNGLAEWKGTVDGEAITAGPGDNGVTLMLLVAARLGSDQLETEFALVLNTALQLLDGVEEVCAMLPRLWTVTGSAAPEDVVRAGVRALYAIGDRLPGTITDRLPRETWTERPTSRVPELAAAAVEWSAAEQGGEPDPAVVAKAAALTSSASKQPVAVGSVTAAPADGVPVTPPGFPEFSSYQKLVDEGHELPLDEPGFQRKLRSEARLHSRGVPTLAWMGMIEDDEHARTRDLAEVVDRAVCLLTVALKAEIINEGDWAAEAPMIESILDTYGVRAALTPAERAFLDDPAPTMHTSTQFIWRYEAFWTLLWALGFIEELSWPTTICDVPRASGIVRDHGPQGLRSAAKLRPIGELLDESDHIYRLHWAVRQSRHNGSFPTPEIDPGVVMERHHALNWLRCYGDQAWDDVSTDT